ncbi:hypothetical protein JX266_008162 [Neoarthrinium moseri]|nr:hypothetical protein JX266_008162 [Neoarthrinium moseri]
MFATSVSQPGHLGPVPEDADQKSHHVKNLWGNTSKFTNPHDSFREPARWDIFGLLFGKLTGLGGWPEPTGAEISVVAPELLPTRTEGHGSANNALRATWLGHACYYVEFPSGLRVLFDPVFEDCCAPINADTFRRYTKPACAIADLPFVDAVIISHSHYDHLSYPTVQEIRNHFPQAHYFVGLGLRSWFEKSGITKVTELDWWEDVELTLTPQGLAEADKAGGVASTSSAATAEKGMSTSNPITARISCLPCQHNSGRGPFDAGKTLWCSWAVSSASGTPAQPENTKSVWFGGDTGYRTVPKVAPHEDDWEPPYDKLPVNPQFAQIGRLRGPFDLGLIPIGAYAPRHVFSSVHGNPYDAVELFRDTKSKRAMGIHWGTWLLTPEEVVEPPRLLKKALKRRGIAEEGVFDVCNVGETREF